MPPNQQSLDSLQLDWESAITKREAVYSFYQSDRTDRFFGFAASIAQQKQVPLFSLNLAESAIYAPFRALLELIRHRIALKQLNVEQLVNSAVAYQPLRRVLTAYLEGQIYRQEELLVIDDLQFEQAELHRSLIRLCELVFTEPCIIAIAGWQSASQTTVEQIKRACTECFAAPLMFMVCFDPNRALQMRQDDENWESFLDWLDDYYLVHTVPALDIDTDYGTEIINKASLTVELVEHNMAIMAWPEVIVAAQKLVSERTLSEAQRIAVTLDMAQAMLYVGRLDDALNELESLQELPSISHSIEEQVRLLNLIALIQAGRQRFDYALQHAQLAFERAEQAQDGRLQAQVRFINFYVHDKAALPISLEAFARLDRSLKTYQMHSSRIYCLRNYYTYLRYYDDLDTRKAFEVTQQAIELSKRIGHLQGIAASYHSKGILYSYSGRYRSTFRCFGVSARLRKQLGEAMDIVRMHNGIGYIYSLLEQYPQALEQYLSAYEAVQEGVDLNELVMTLYNIAWNYVCTRNYRDAVDVMDRLVQICRIRQLTHLPFRNLHDVFSLKGYCHAKLGELGRAQQCLDRMRRLTFKPSRTGKFLCYLNKGALFAAMGRLNDAQLVLESAPDILGNVVDMDSHLIPLCHVELASVYSQQKNWSALDRLLTKSLKLCDKLTLPKFSELFDRIKQMAHNQEPIGSGSVPPQPLEPVSLHLDDLVRLIRQETKLIQANQRLREVQLISRLQALPDRFDSPVELASETLRMVSVAFAVQAAQLHQFRAGNWKLCCETGQIPDADASTRYLTAVKQKAELIVDTRLHSRGEEGQRATFDSTLCVPVIDENGLSAALTLYLFDSNRHFDRHDQDTLLLLTAQLGTQLQQLRHRERLLLMSTTDALTQLFNRQAMQTRLERELVSMRHERRAQVCSLAYVDLDNFKSVNDTLGHGIGDELLKAFANLLGRTLRQGDIAARWGGDEFVVLFPGTDAQQAKRVAQRLLDRMTERQQFIPELTEWSGEDVSADKIQLGCSIGIVDCHTAELDWVDEDWMLRHADKAMYRAKEAGKGEICIAAKEKK